MTSANSTTPAGPEFPAAGMRLFEAPMAADAPDDPTVAVCRATRAALHQAGLHVRPGPQPGTLLLPPDPPAPDDNPQGD